MGLTKIDIRGSIYLRYKVIRASSVSTGIGLHRAEPNIQDRNIQKKNYTEDARLKTKSHRILVSGCIVTV